MTVSNATREQRQVVHDMEAIRQLRRRYAFSVETGRLEGLDDVFVPEARVVVPHGTMRGLSAIKARLVEKSNEMASSACPRRPFAHALVRHDIDLKAEGTATGRCYVIDYETNPTPDAQTAIGLKAFRDEYRVVDGSWRITETVIESD